MRVAHLSTNESSGGAAVAARRLHLGLVEQGVESRFLVSRREADTLNASVVGGKFFRRLIVPAAALAAPKLLDRLYKRPEYGAYFTLSGLPSPLAGAVNALPHDVLNLHWICGGFVSPWALQRLRGPVVWTVHDTWPLTGGCHYLTFNCERYKQNCGACPTLGSSKENDLSRRQWKLKRKAIEALRPVIVCPSLDYAVKAKESGLLQGCRVETIPNGIDTRVYRPIPKAQARAVLGLPQDEPLLLFGAMNAATDHNKGFDLLQQALRHLSASYSGKFSALVFGSSHAELGLPCPVNFLGRLHDDISLTLAYSAADIFICPSRQENFPNTVLEALACGTPVAGFAVGGLPDAVEQGQTGFLAKPYDTLELAGHLANLLKANELRQGMGLLGREKVEQNFALPVVARQYLRLYEELSANREIDF